MIPLNLRPMHRLFHSVLFAPLLPASSAWACSCVFIPPTFCETMGPDWIGAPDLIVLAVKLNDVYHGMDVEVAQTITGTAQPGDVLRVWGDNGNSCRVYTNTWAVGDTVLLALFPTDLMGNFFGPDLEQPGERMIFNCGQYYLNYSQGMLQGPVAPGLAQLPLSELPTFLQGCLTTALPTEVAPSAFRVEHIGDQLIVHPPAAARHITLQVLDLQGRTVVDQRAAGKPMTVNVGELPSACYVLRLWADGVSFSQRYVLP